MRTGFMAESSFDCACEEGSGQYPREYACGVVSCQWVGNLRPSAQPTLERMIDSENMRLAWKQVKRNGGADGLDGRSIEEIDIFPAKLARTTAEITRCRLSVGRGRFSWRPIWGNVLVSKEINNDCKEKERNPCWTSARRTAFECCPQT